MGTLQAPIGYQTKAATISNSAKGIDHADFGFSAAELADADYAVVTAFSNPAVFTADGTTPTSTLGTYLESEDTMVVRGNPNVNNLQFIRAGSSDATVSVSLFRFST